MFPLLRTRAARALDVAIEFATLGEYRLADPVAPVAPARGARRRAEPAERREGARARPAARLVVPASVAARVRLGPVPEPSSIKDYALTGEGVVATPPVRARGGAAPPVPQPCESPRR